MNHISLVRKKTALDVMQGHPLQVHDSVLGELIPGLFYLFMEWPGNEPQHSIQWNLSEIRNRG